MVTTAKKENNRVRIHLPVKISNNESECRSVSYDVSPSGIFIFNTDDKNLESLELNLEIDLEIDLKNDKILSCKGKIIRHHEAQGTYPKGMGVQFSNLGDQDKKMLERFVGLKTLTL